jgi:hypothetical protein
MRNERVELNVGGILNIPWGDLESRFEHRRIG